MPRRWRDADTDAYVPLSGRLGRQQLSAMSVAGAASRFTASLLYGAEAGESARRPVGKRSWSFRWTTQGSVIK